MGGQAEIPAEIPDEVRGDEGDVRPALPKRRDVQGDDVEAVVEVLAELAFPDAVLEVFVCRRDEAEVALDGLCGPEAVDELLLENAQQLGLHLQRKLADLVEEDRPLVGKLELARLSLVAGPREGARLVAEKLRLQEILRDGGAVEPDEGQLVALARPVDGVGEEFLPRTALPDEKDGASSPWRPAVPSSGDPA